MSLYITPQARMESMERESAAMKARQAEYERELKAVRAELKTKLEDSSDTICQMVGRMSDLKFQGTKFEQQVAALQRAG